MPLSKTVLAKVPTMAASNTCICTYKHLIKYRQIAICMDNRAWNLRYSNMYCKYSVGNQNGNMTLKGSFPIKKHELGQIMVYLLVIAITFLLQPVRPQRVAERSSALL